MRPSRAVDAQLSEGSSKAASNEALNERRISWSSRGTRLTPGLFMAAFGLLKERRQNSSQGDNQRHAAETDGSGAPERRVAGRTGLLGHVGEREHQRDQRQKAKGCSEDVEITAHSSAICSIHSSTIYFRARRALCPGLMSAAVLMACLPGTAAAQKVAQPATEQQRVEQLVRMDRAWGPEMTTQGMMLTLVERQRSSDGVTYSLKAVGVPNDKPFVLLTWTLGDTGPKKLMYGVTLGANGEALCGNLEGPCRDSRPGDLLMLRFQTEPGEPVRVALMVPDNSAKLLAEEMPLPLVANDGGCRLRGVLLAKNAEVVLVEGTGFPPVTPMTVTSVSNGETRTDIKRTDQDGYFLMANLPKTPGTESGEMKMTVKSQSCAPTLTVPWGQMQIAQGQDNAKKPIEAGSREAQQ